MSRPWVIWSILIVCGLLIAGAMGWLTRRTLGMERERIEVEARSKVEERVRLALSRMDTAAAALLVIENQRPPEHYRAFYEPKVLFTNTLQSVSGSLVTQPSPLLADPPEFVRLHFEVWAHDELTSPQVPTGNLRDLAEASGAARDAMDEAAKRLERLHALLTVPVRGQALNRIKAQGAPGDNLDRMIWACQPTAETWNSRPTQELVTQQKMAWGNEELQEVVANSYAQPQVESAYQQGLTSVDRGKRMEVYNDVQSKAASNAVFKSQFFKPKADDLAKEEEKAGQQSDVSQQPLLANPSSVQRDGQWKDQAVPSGQQAQEPPPQASSPSQTRAAAAATQAPPVTPILDLEVTPFRPVWVEGELMAIRQVRSEQGVRYQGFWIDALALRDSLLAKVSDLLPEARLTPVAALVGIGVGEIYQNGGLHPDDRSLVTLPWRLDEGIKVDVGLTGFTPLHASLAAGWLAVLLAMLAAAVLVQGVLRMSERRAAFVSSVTHELRTPLTTFQLYSDLLAEGMVRDEDKRQNYLETMRREAGRLNHLIENVLSYSRIERGSARAQRERLTLGQLVGRFERRLQERALREMARFEVCGLDACAEVEIETDVTAVEQIIFNLVDNACKYGLPEAGQGAITLQIAAAGRSVEFSVCDAGGGILRRDRHRLFRPFHKSAHDAANSKPGVGLGLALCRRLARALGGDVVADCNREKGACFVLRLPRNDRGS